MAWWQRGYLLLTSTGADLQSSGTSTATVAATFNRTVELASTDTSTASTSATLTQTVDLSSVGTSTASVAATFNRTVEFASTGTSTATVAAVLTSAATPVQEGYRWGTDDGTEASHGWHAPQDLDPTSLPGLTTTLLRVLVEETGGTTLTAGYVLQYKRDDEPASEWRAVTV